MSIISAGSISHDSTYNTYFTLKFKNSFNLPLYSLQILDLLHGYGPQKDMQRYTIFYFIFWLG
jgi:hypothetical protein